MKTTLNILTAAVASALILMATGLVLRLYYLLFMLGWRAV